MKKLLLERALELAYEGDLLKLSHIAAQLHREGYEQANQHLGAPTVKRMLQAERQRGERDRVRAAALPDKSARL